MQAFFIFRYWVLLWFMDYLQLKNILKIKVFCWLLLFLADCDSQLFQVEKSMSERQVCHSSSIEEKIIF